MSDPRTPVFEAVRAIARAGVFNEPGNIQALHNLLDAFGAPREIVSRRAISSAGVALIHSFESCRLKAYPDPGSKDGRPWTIGWGSTTDLAGKPIAPGTVWTQAECDAKFREDLRAFEDGVSRLIVNAPTSQAQFDALVSLAYNIGLAAFGDSTLLRKHKAGDHAGAAKAFGSWVYNDGRKLNGLIRRREAEARHYRGLIG